MYRAPIKDLRFVIHELIGEAAIRSCPRFADYSADTTDAILDEAARFAEGVLDPIQKSGDREGAKWTPDGVVTPPGFKQAYEKFVAGGWTQLSAPPQYGGQGAPTVMATALEEIWASANLAFKLCPMLTQGAIEALEHCGSDEQKQLYLPKMVSGEWTGTMNLTEPQAGSDLGAIRTRAVPDGSRYRIVGQKIFITYGDHDFTSNIIHMVLARIEGAPAGTKGISLFIVPKVLVNADGSLGERNEVRCVSIEHKLGIHASPTCVLAYGDGQGAVGYLVGEPNRGLEYMFIMMNAARLAVGLEGYGIAERAFQQAAEWARTRVQGKPPVASSTGSPLPIIHHPDIKRMLLTMKSTTEAMRALGLYAAHQLDLGAHHPDRAKREAAQARGDLLIPIVKGWSTENGVELASLGVQIHGGMGFIEETGAAQLLRDVRITAIYEGTTGIQANDLIGRKVGRDRGAALGLLLADVAADLDAIKSDDAAVRSARNAALEGLQLLREATVSLLASLESDPKRGLAVAVPYLMAAGTVLGGWLMAKSAALAAAKIAAGSQGTEFYSAKLASSRFYAGHVSPLALSYVRIVTGGVDSVIATDAALIG
jgi:alkylation response protein AidB-like acyl-CoA dehydrogenase